MNLLGAVSEDGETLVNKGVDSFTSDVTVRFLQSLQDEFDEHFHVILDNATYFA